MGPKAKWLQRSNLRHDCFPSTVLNDKNATNATIHTVTMNHYEPLPETIASETREGR